MVETAHRLPSLFRLLAHVGSHSLWQPHSLPRCDQVITRARGRLTHVPSGARRSAQTGGARHGDRAAAETPSDRSHRQPSEQPPVFCSQEELVLVFEGSGAERAARALTHGHENALSPYIAAPPRLTEEVFSWYWPQAPAGVSFSAWPGPGDSDGGTTE